jgi:chemotaxis receptor (MCP) glutamine deamidase CheD
MANGYFYAHSAIHRLLYLLKQQHPAIRDASLRMVMAGGMNNEGPVSETLSELRKYRFKVIGRDVNEMLHRHVIFDICSGIVTVNRKVPFSEVKSPRCFCF